MTLRPVIFDLQVCSCLLSGSHDTWNLHGTSVACVSVTTSLPANRNYERFFKLANLAISWGHIPICCYLLFRSYLLVTIVAEPFPRLGESCGYAYVRGHVERNGEAEPGPLIRWEIAVSIKSRWVISDEPVTSNEIILQLLTPIRSETFGQVVWAARDGPQIVCNFTLVNL